VTKAKVGPSVQKFERCPFSNRKLRYDTINLDGVEYTIVVSPFGWRSKPFHSLDRAKEWAGTRGGTKTFRRPRVEVGLDPDEKREAEANDAQVGLDEEGHPLNA